MAVGPSTARMLRQYFYVWVLAYIISHAAAQCPEAPVVSHSMLVDICSKDGPAKSAIGCSMYNICRNTTLNPPIYSSLCATWRIASSLCSDGTIIADSTGGLCTRLQASYPSAAQFRSCMMPYAIQSTSQITNLHINACGQMEYLSDMLGCESCTNSYCPDPLVSYSAGCYDMDMGQCKSWASFCGGEATPDGDVRNKFGFGAAYLCRAPHTRAGIVAPPLPPSPPPSSPPPSPPALSTPSPLSSPASKPPSGVPPPPSPPPACIANSSSPACVSYEYPILNIITDITNLCTAMPYMPGCTVGKACQAGQVTGGFCQPMTLLASICADMPGMGGCRSYVPLCKNTSVVQQCKQFPAIPGLPTTMQAKAAVLQRCDAAPTADVCNTCNLMSCSDYLTPLSSLCTGVSGLENGCATYTDWCSAAAAWETGDTTGRTSLGAFCSRAPPPHMPQYPSERSPSPRPKSPPPRSVKAPPPPVKKQPSPQVKRSPPPGAARKPPSSTKRSPPPSPRRRPPSPRRSPPSKKRSPPPSHRRPPPSRRRPPPKRK